MASKIPKIVKFKGDNDQNFATWIKQYEAHCVAVGVVDDKKLDTLLCCVDGTAFTYLCELKDDDANPATYATVKAAFLARFCGDEFKRCLQLKLQNLKFTKGTSINTFVNELNTTIKQLYGITDANIIAEVARNHVVNNLEPSLRDEAKMFQLSGSVKLENLLEFVSLKMSASSFGYKEASVMETSAMSTSEKGRLERLESMMEKLLTKMDGPASGNRSRICEECHKVGHTRQSCFRLRVCHNCEEKGHIAKYCTKPAKTSAAVLTNNKAENLPGQRTMIKIQIGDTPIDFLYDTGSQYSILTRKTYDALCVKPPLGDVQRSGSGIDGHKFDFDGMVYLNLAFKTESGKSFTLQYEPVLISSAVSCNIYGAKTENRFKSCIRDLQNGTITYNTNECSEPITLQCFKEKQASEFAFVEVLHMVTIPQNEVHTVKGRISNINELKEHKQGSDIFCVTDPTDNLHSFRIKEFITSDMEKRVNITVQNTSGDELKLEKGQVIAEVKLVETCEDTVEVFSQSDSNAPHLDEHDLHELSESERKQLSGVLLDYYKKIEGTHVCGNLPPEYEHEIRLKDDIPVACKPRLMAHAYEKEAKEIIEKLLKEGVIERSNSPYASPIVLVNKKDGSFRLCYDFRKLNAKSIPKVFPIPRSEHMFENIKDAEVFTVLDLKSAYWHIPIKTEDREKTAFVSSHGKYQWNVLPYGITDAAFSLNRAMKILLEDYERFLRSWYDDCFLFSLRKEHIGCLKLVLDTFAAAGIHINFRKCQFMKTSVVFLGHVVSTEGVKPDVSKTLSIVNFTEPKNTKEVRTFMGMAAYYRNFVPAFAEKAAPLYELLRKDVKFSWDVIRQKAFTTLKNELQSCNILVHADFTKPFVIVSDASKIAIGFVLMQEKEGELRTVRFGGRALTKAESRYATTDQELLGIYFAIKKCEYYLLGNSFVCYTDHKPLVHLKAFKSVLNKRYRWIQYLESLNTVIRYIPGKENIISDYISRNIKDEEKLDVLVDAMDITDVVSYKPEELKNKQQNDAVIRHVTDSILQKVKLPREYCKFTSKLSIDQRDILLYKHNGHNKIVAPVELREELLELGHSQVFSGHHGIFKTHRHILETSWWPNMFADVSVYIKNCKTCILKKSDNRKRCRLGRREFPQKPLDFVAIDFIVELPPTTHGNIHILTVVDHFTKFLKVYALKDRTARTAADRMYDYSMLFGVPKTIYSDKDPAFRAEFFECFVKCLGMKKRMTTGYNPKANGLCERSNGIVKQLLLKYVNFFGGEWDQWLRELMYAYNTSVHSSTGFSPAELMYGRKMRLPIDLVFSYGSNDDVTYQNISELKSNLQKIYEIARENMTSRQDTAATYYDKSVLDDQLDLHGQVYVFNSRSSKLGLRWSGPFKILKCEHPSYLVEIEERNKMVEKWFTRDKLRRTENRFEIEEEVQTEENDLSDDSSTDEDAVDSSLDNPRSNVYNLRSNVRAPDRYGSYVTHFMKTCIGD